MADLNKRLVYADDRTENWAEHDVLQAPVNVFAPVRMEVDVKSGLMRIMFEAGDAVTGRMQVQRTLVAHRDDGPDWAAFFNITANNGSETLGSHLRRAVLAAGRSKGFLPTAVDSKDEP